MKLSRCLSALIFGFAVVAPAIHAQTYSTPTTGGIGSFGQPNTATYGQTFVAPNSYLDSYTVSLTAYGVPLNFQFDVMAWGGTSATGGFLYQSAVATDSVNGVDQSFTFTPDLALTKGDTYIALINESNLNSNDPGAEVDGSEGTDPLGGQFVFLNNGDDGANLLSDLDGGGWWTNGWTPNNLAYTAVFSSSASVPDKNSSLYLMAAGLATLAAVAFRRRLQGA